MNIKEFQEILEQEKEELKATLSTISSQDPKNPSDWQAKYPDMNIDTADKMDVADEVEEYETDIGINAVLEEKYRDVEAALERIKNGTYGKCTVGGETIDEARLRANPSAGTCTAHAS